MERYDGSVPIEQDESNQNSVLAGLHNFVAGTLDVNRLGGAADEREDLVAAIRISLNRINVPTVGHRRSKDDFTIESLIGYGSFGQIWKADSERFGPVALKILKADPTELTDLWKERDLMVLLKHKRICNLLAAFYDKDIFFVLELCHGSVAHLNSRISKENAVRFSVQLLQAVEWIHSNQVVHADIKPDNCLVNTSNNLVLSDFGSSIYLGPDRTMVRFNQAHGSPGYMDLRANEHLEFSPSTDVFAAACVIYELSTKTPLLFYRDQPDQNRDLYIDAFHNGRIIQQSGTLAREPIWERAMRCSFGPLLDQMIQEDNRLTAQQSLEDGTLRTVMSDAKVSLETVDKSSKYVTNEFSEDLIYTFNNQPLPTSPELDLALLTFDYEDKTLPERTKSGPTGESSSDDEPAPRKSMARVSKHDAKRRKVSSKSKSKSSSSMDSTSDSV